MVVSKVLATIEEVYFSDDSFDPSDYELKVCSVYKATNLFDY